METNSVMREVPSPAVQVVTAGFLSDTLDRQERQEVILTGPERSAIYYLTKRLFDCVISVFLLLMLAPFMLLIAGLIKLDSPGPAIFLQRRAGSKRRNTGRGATWRVSAFDCYKFRSMYTNADDSAHKEFTHAFIRGEPLPRKCDRNLFKLTGDPRVTRVGRILRKASLDELPQLINVLRGEMTLVGPRPIPTYELASYKPHHWQRLAAKPGLTGLWQVKGRCQVDFEGMVRMDVEYINNQSLFLDLKLLLLTIPAVILNKGAE
jgi:lipopolysaccharide/colanic/teichoic acid biosynthesis glycosyltransferase